MAEFEVLVSHGHPEIAVYEVVQPEGVFFRYNTWQSSRRLYVVMLLDFHWLCCHCLTIEVRIAFFVSLSRARWVDLCVNSYWLALLNVSSRSACLIC